MANAQSAGASGATKEHATDDGAAPPSAAAFGPLIATTVPARTAREATEPVATRKSQRLFRYWNLRICGQCRPMDFLNDVTDTSAAAREAAAGGAVREASPPPPLDIGAAITASTEPAAAPSARTTAYTASHSTTAVAEAHWRQPACQGHIHRPYATPRHPAPQPCRRALPFCRAHRE